MNMPSKVETLFRELSVPGHNDEAQKALVGAVVENPDWLKDVKPEWLDQKYRIIHRAACALKADGFPVTEKSVYLRLMDTGEFSKDAKPSDVCEVLKHARNHADRKDFELCRAGVEKAWRRREHFRLFLDGVEKVCLGQDVSAEIAELHVLALGKVSGGLPAVVSAADWSPELPKLDPVIIDGLLRKGAKLVLGGSAKTRKSWHLIQLALCITNGMDFWGMPCTRQRALYINMELPEREMEYRTKTICDALQCSRDGLYIWNMNGHARGIEQLENDIVNAIESHDIDVVLLDPVYKVLGSRIENSNEDVASLLNIADSICNRSGAGFIFVHHFSKGPQGGKFVEDRISGAGAWWRDPDAGIFVTALEEDDCYSVSVRARSFPPRDDFAIRSQHPIAVIDDTLDPENIRQPGRKRKVGAEQLVTLLEGGPLTRKDWRERSEEEFQIGHSTFDRRVADAEGKGLVSNNQGIWMLNEATEKLPQN